MANRFITGTDGRVRNGTGQNIIAGIMTWKLDPKTSIFPIPHFESPVDAFGRVWPNTLPGLSTATGSLEGYFNTDPTNYTDNGVPQISNGFACLLDLIISKTYTWGFYGVVANFTDFSISETVENQPVKFTAAFMVNGIVPTSSAGIG